MAGRIRLRRAERRSRVAIAKFLQAKRRERKISQQEIAALLARPQSYVARIESGEKRVELSEIIVILDAIGIPLSELERILRRELKPTPAC